MCLPYDIARCEAVKGEAICQTCRRTEQGDSNRQWYLTPTAFKDNCGNYISPKTEDK